MRLRSAEWFEGRDELGPQHRAVLRTLGLTGEFSAGRPVIAIANTWSEFNNCNLGLRSVADAVRRGVLVAGGIPLEFNAIALGEELMKPSAMLYRNLLAMEVEEQLRSQPIDGVILLAGCDKTTPGQLMGAASADLPAIQVCAGPKNAGRWKGREIGSGTDLWRYWDAYRAGDLSADDWHAIEAAYSASIGTCNTMGTASTMAVVSEALGMMLPGSATIGATDTRRLAIAELSGRRAVELVRDNIRPSTILTRKAFENALRVLMAVGGSTNAVLHLLAIAGRLCVPLTLDDINAFAETTPLLLDLQPSGSRLMADFDMAGGVPALMRELKPLLHLGCTGVGGRELGDELKHNLFTDPSVIRPLDAPLQPAPTLVVLRGNLAPRGALIRTATASLELRQHRGPALVFDSYADMLERIDDPALPVSPATVLVLRNAGAVGVPGMPEWGAIPVPKKLLQAGVRDMVRLSDSRMSGTSSGSIVLHITPEAAVGGPLALVCDGDLIELDVDARRLDLLVDEAVLARRSEKWTAPAPAHRRGYPRLYAEHVLQADQGCDFDFLRPSSTAELAFIAPIVGRS